MRVFTDESGIAIANRLFDTQEAVVSNLSPQPLDYVGHY